MREESKAGKGGRMTGIKISVHQGSPEVVRHGDPRVF